MLYQILCVQHALNSSAPACKRETARDPRQGSTVFVFRHAPDQPLTLRGAEVRPLEVVAAPGHHQADVLRALEGDDVALLIAAVLVCGSSAGGKAGPGHRTQD